MWRKERGDFEKGDDFIGRGDGGLVVVAPGRAVPGGEGSESRSERVRRVSESNKENNVPITSRRIRPITLPLSTPIDALTLPGSNDASRFENLAAIWSRRRFPFLNAARRGEQGARSKSFHRYRAVDWSWFAVTQRRN